MQSTRQSGEPAQDIEGMVADGLDVWTAAHVVTRYRNVVRLVLNAPARLQAALQGVYRPSGVDLVSVRLIFECTHELLGVTTKVINDFGDVDSWDHSKARF
jgi:hypothetical protein